MDELNQLRKLLADPKRVNMFDPYVSGLRDALALVALLQQESGLAKEFYSKITKRCRSSKHNIRI